MRLGLTPKALRSYASRLPDSSEAGPPCMRSAKKSGIPRSFECCWPKWRIPFSQSLLRQTTSVLMECESERRSSEMLLILWLIERDDVFGRHKATDQYFEI